MGATEFDLNPIDQLDPFVILAIIIIVTITYFVLRRVFVLPYVRVMEERERLFTEADAKAAEAAAATREAEAEGEQAIAEATAEGEQVIAQARERCESYRSEAIEAAMRSASDALEHGRAEIAAKREAQEDELRHRAVECVSVAYARLIGGSDAEAVQAAVDHALARRVH